MTVGRGNVMSDAITDVLAVVGGSVRNVPDGARRKMIRVTAGGAARNARNGWQSNKTRRWCNGSISSVPRGRRGFDSDLGA